MENKSNKFQDFKLKLLLIFSYIYRLLFIISCTLLVIALIISMFMQNNDAALNVSSKFILIGMLFITLYMFTNTSLVMSVRKAAAYYIPIALKSALDRVESHNSKTGLAESYITQDFGSPDYNSASSTEYVKGTLKGVPLEFSKVLLTRVTRGRNREGEIRTNYSLSFKGAMLVCRHSHILQESFCITQLSQKDKPTTNNEDFNNSFYISGGNSEEISNILTDTYINSIINLSKHLNKKFALRFNTDGTLLIAIEDADFFEVEETTYFRMQSIPKTVKKMVKPYKVKNSKDLIKKFENQVKTLGEVLELLEIYTYWG